MAAPRRNRRQKLPVMAQVFQSVGTSWLPFADAASGTLPMARLLRLALFQVSVGMALVLLNATLNRVMIVEMGMSSGLVAIMIALPLFFAPARILIGHKSDTHKSFLGWRRVPYIWFGTMFQFGGLAIMPFALLNLSGDTTMQPIVGQLGAALAFLLTGAGLHTTQTAGLALATDLADEDKRGRVVALLYVMLLIGMMVSAFILGGLLEDFSQKRLIQVIQGAAVVTMALNVIALWKQEGRNTAITHPSLDRPSFQESWALFRQTGKPMRLLIATGLGAAAFSMQDILLEPYGGEILGLGVGATTMLTALLALGTLIGFSWSARRLSKGGDTAALAAHGALIGLVAFPAVIFADTLQSALLFRTGVFLIGLGTGLFSVGTLTAAMSLSTTGVAKTSREGITGMALGAWGAVQATAMGIAVSTGGIIRDMMHVAQDADVVPSALANPSMGYIVVYHLEILLLFATLIAIGPLVRRGPEQDVAQRSQFGLAEFPS